MSFNCKANIKVRTRLSEKIDGNLIFALRFDYSLLYNMHTMIVKCLQSYNNNNIKNFHSLHKIECNLFIVVSVKYLMISHECRKCENMLSLKNAFSEECFL